jgi:large subunit ribosomal protein L29
MKPSEVRAMSDGELAEAVENSRQEMFNLRFQAATGRLPDTGRLRIVRRRLACLLTVQRERELWAAYEAAASKEG